MKEEVKKEEIELPPFLEEKTVNPITQMKAEVCRKFTHKESTVGHEHKDFEEA